MQIRFANQAINEIEADAVLLALAETDSPPAPAGLDDSVRSWIADLYASGEFKGKLFELATLHRPPGMKAKRLVVTGTGKPDKAADAELRFAMGTAMRNVKKASPD